MEEEDLSISDLGNEDLEEEPAEGEETPEPQEPGGYMEKLKAESPDRPLSDYNNHPLNFAHEEDISQVLRGMEGLLGSLKYAVIDILVGVIRYAWRKKSEVSEVEETEFGPS